VLKAQMVLPERCAVCTNKFLWYNWQYIDLSEERTGELRPKFAIIGKKVIFLQ
jgi:hypothetical protein